MNEQLQTISDEQKKTWDKVSHGWKKWNEFTMNFLKPMGDAIIMALSIKNNDVVLDIASGTGEPAFSIAAIAKNFLAGNTDTVFAALHIQSARFIPQNFTRSVLNAQ